MRTTNLPPPVPETVAVDIDGTLIKENGELSKAVLAWAQRRKAEGKTVILWSSKGETYAKQVAEKLGIADSFSLIIGKPTVIVDDHGWGWTRFTKAIHPKRIN